jgi:transcription initiation factor TFIID subunit 13
VARTSGRAKIKVDDFKFAVRNDPKKLGRIEELLQLQKVIQDAKRLFDNAEGKPTKESKSEK